VALAECAAVFLVPSVLRELILAVAEVPVGVGGVVLFLAFAEVAHPFFVWRVSRAGLLPRAEMPLVTLVAWLGHYGLLSDIGLR
jgi:hypothetical protein